VDARLVLTESILHNSIETVLQSDRWRTSSAIYQVLKLGMDMALLAAFEDELSMSLPNIASYGTGVSLGELEVLAAAEVWEFHAALMLLKKRGECIERHQPPAGQWDAHALIGVMRDAVSEAIEGLHGRGFTTLSITNHNGEVVVIVGGHRKELEALAQELKSANGKIKVNTNLRLGNIFHHPTLRAAANEFEETVRQSSPNEPTIKVLSNVTGVPHEDAAHLPRLLGRHLVHPVELVENIKYLLSQGVENIIVIGSPGPLKTLLGKKFKKIWVIDSLDSLWNVKRELLLSC
jgi:[acyl-carrier-protein] S-malonyltransferase